MISQFNFPTTIRFGVDVVKELAGYLQKNGLSKPMIVTDPTVAELSFLKAIVKDLQRNNISVEVFSGIHKKSGKVRRL